MNQNELVHWGIKGMHWGTRRYQNADGTWTEEGKARRRDDRLDLSTASDDDIRKETARLKLEQEYLKAYLSIHPAKQNRVKKVVADIIEDSSKAIVKGAINTVITRAEAKAKALGEAEGKAEGDWLNNKKKKNEEKQAKKNEDKQAKKNEDKPAKKNEEPEIKKSETPKDEKPSSKHVVFDSKANKYVDADTYRKEHENDYVNRPSGNSPYERAQKLYREKENMKYSDVEVNDMDFDMFVRIIKARQMR